MFAKQFTIESVAATLALFGFYTTEAGCFQLDNGNVIIGVDCFEKHIEVGYIVGAQVMGRWNVLSVNGLLTELRAANANFKGYPGYKSILDADVMAAIYGVD
jgi:hypothetical protein